LFFPSASFLDTEPKGKKQVHVCVGHKAHNDVLSGIILQCNNRLYHWTQGLGGYYAGWHENKAVGFKFWLWNQELLTICITHIDLPPQLRSVQLLIDLDSPHWSPAPTTAAYSEISCELKKENILLGFPFMTYLVKDRSCRWVGR